MHIYRNWFLASRPWSFTMTAISITVGACFGAIDGEFSWSLYAMTLVAGVMMHGATNLINDYYDVKMGVDTPEVSTAQYRPHPLVEGKLTARQIFWEAVVLYTVAVAIGLYLAETRGWVLFWIGIIGLVASITYTAPPFNYKYRALGEFSVFIMWGPLMVEGAYFVQRQAFSVQAFWVSLPFGTLVALVLLANNIRDVRYDSERGIRTIPILLGQRKGRVLYLSLVAIAYLSVVLMALVGMLPSWSLIVLLSLPLAYRLFVELIKTIPNDADARTAQLDTVFGLLLVVSLVLEGLF